MVQFLGTRSLAGNSRSPPAPFQCATRGSDVGGVRKNPHRYAIALDLQLGTADGSRIEHATTTSFDNNNARGSRSNPLPNVIPCAFERNKCRSMILPAFEDLIEHLNLVIGQTLASTPRLSHDQPLLRCSSHRSRRTIGTSPRRMLSGPMVPASRSKSLDISCPSSGGGVGNFQLP